MIIHTRKTNPKRVNLTRQLQFPILTHIVIKAWVRYFLKIFSLSPNVSPSKTMKDVFISSKKLFSFSRYLNFCIFPLFLPVSHCVRAWSKINLEVYDIINCLNNNLIHLVWYLEKEKRYGIEILSIDRVLNNEHFYGKIMQKMCTKS